MDPTTREIDTLSPAATACRVLRFPKCPQNQKPGAIESLPDELIVLITEKLDAPSLANFAAASASCLAAAHGELRAALLAAVQRCLTNCAVFGAGPVISALVACPYFHLPDDLVDIPANAFMHSALRQLTLPVGVTTTGHNAFNGTSLCESPSPAHLATIGIDAFSNCRCLTKVDLSCAAALTAIGEGAFRSCSSLHQLFLPAAVTTIGFVPRSTTSFCPLHSLPSAPTPSRAVPPSR